MSSRVSTARLRSGQASSGDGGRLNQTADYNTYKSTGPTKTTRSSSLSDSLVILFLLFVCSFVAIALHSHWTLPSNVVTKVRNSFNTQDARKHLNDIVELGIRHVGSEANEIHAVNVIMQKVEKIRKLASQSVEIELSLQRPSGSFSIDFPDRMTQLYQNISNVVVRFRRRGSKPEHAILINAHYDSAVGSPAASDDAVSCAIMLEILESLTSDPQPFLPDHSVIFLFNGAEETILQASHGFITQHPWASEVRVFLNLEAAGAGGKEIVFQTGPDHPWLARMYASIVPYPCASVIAQEVFQSGLIPSDTDFRIFRDYGHIPGIDMAFFVNGYVYHTKYDTADRIPDGSIQRAGVNVLSMVKALSISPLLDDPGADRHGKVIFFDVLGQFSIVYPEQIALIINSLVVIGCLASIYWRISLKPQQLDKPSIGMVLKGVLVTIGSWVTAIVVNVLTALLVGYTGHSMSWFSHPLLLIPLYAIPALLGMAEVHSFWLKQTPVLKAHLCEQTSLYSLMLVYMLVLTLLTYLRVCSAFYFTVSLLFILFFRHLIWDGILCRMIQSSRYYRTVFVICEAASVSIPFIFGFLLAMALLEFLVPLFGRAGGIVPPDLTIAVMIAVLICLISSTVVPFVVHTASKRLRMLMAGCLAFLYISGLVITLSGTAFPYSGGNHPAPKRLFLQHVNRRFLNQDGSTRLTDSSVIFITADYLDMAPISDSVPEIGSALRKWECKGVFCGIPFYLPLFKYINQFWYLPAPQVENTPDVSLNLISIVNTVSERKNFTFTMHIPSRVSIFISPRNGQTLTQWSLVKTVPSPIPCNHKELHGDKCFFIFYCRGVGDAGITFWLEIEGPTQTDGVVEIVVAAQLLDPPMSITPTLTALEDILPDWVTPITWTSTYTSWIF